MKPPLLLLKSSSLAPLVLAEAKLVEIGENFPEDPNSSLYREGLFVLAVATIEIMMNDVLAAIIRAIPDKLSEKNLSIPKDTFIQMPSAIIDEQIHKYLIKFAYGNLRENLDSFCENLSIDLMRYRKEYEPSMIEIKESRNLLLHNSLRVNSLYLSKAGTKSRGKLDERLEIDVVYFRYSLNLLHNFCVTCREAITSKYKEYTTARAIRSIWEYIFTTPVLDFDKHWSVVVDKDGQDEQVVMKSIDFHPGISTSEKMFLGIWLNHYSGSGNDYIKELNFNSLLDDKKEMMLWLLTVLSRIRLYS